MKLVQHTYILNVLSLFIYMFFRLLLLLLLLLLFNRLYFILLQGFQIPKGWTVVFSIRETHENTDLFSNGDQFNPDRWETIKDERFNYLPFGGGRRSCPGQEFAILVLKIFAIELSRNCTWKLLNESAQMRYLPVPHPVDGLPVTFSQLSSKATRTRSSTV